MVEDEGKQEEEKFEFTPEGEALGYISPKLVRHPEDLRSNEHQAREHSTEEA